MAAWSSFPTDLLDKASLSTADMTVQFMWDWNSAASSNCTNNPVDVSRSVSGSSACKKLSASRTARNYPSHDAAASAFSAQVHSGAYPHLLAALKTDNPYAYSDPASVVGDLNKWGSPKQAAYYGTFAKPGSGSSGGSGGSGASLPKGHTGFNDFQKALGHSLPTNLRRSKIIRGRVLQKLGAPRRVR